MKIANFSHYDGDINWNLARKELDFVIFRASVGSNLDKKYVEYAKECNLPFGVYHYVKAGTASEAIREANLFYEAATQEGLQPLFYCADIEYEAQNAQTTYTVTENFANTLRAKGCKKLGLYISQSRYNYAKRDAYDFIWIPRYGKDTGEADLNYLPKYPCDLWQFTSNGYLNGANEGIELNQLVGNKTVEWFINGYTKKEEKNMAEKFTNTHFVEFVKGFLGMPYWY